MKTLTWIMSQKSKNEYWESCRARYPSRNRQGKSAMIDEVSDTPGWDRKHAIKALNGKVSLGGKARKRGLKAVCGEAEMAVIIEIRKRSEQPCGKRLKQTLPLWIESYESRYGKVAKETRRKVLACSPRQLDRITAPHKLADESRHGRKKGRTSHRLKATVPVRCGPWEVDGPGWFEGDTVSHGGGSSSGEFMWSLTLTDIFSGWTELVGLWGQTGGEVCQGLRVIAARLPFPIISFDTDNGSEFLNTVLESYLRDRATPIHWIRSRSYKKNDQAHGEQMNFTHVRQLLGYGRYDDIRFVEHVNDLYTTAWLPLRNYFTPVMKLVEKTRSGSKVTKKYDVARTPCDRLLDCHNVPAAVKSKLRAERGSLDPLTLSEQIEEKLAAIFEIIDRIEERRAEEVGWLEEIEAGAATTPAATDGPGYVA
ncbi:integrase catalytic domain-containing protein, partial [Haloferula sp.]|uniref:integrase catalytic domain-containing protein n=1 Tax=Haloferula sp. TaxID=2497595 RepID=UPI003C70C5C3